MRMETLAVIAEWKLGTSAREASAVENPSVHNR
jgi:hypothetical protein